MTVITPLYGHTSVETAYVVDDYPYSFKLRCAIRYWLDYKSKLGFRFVSQTTNPKVAYTHWNKPKCGTYHLIAACMYLDEKGHCTYSTIDIYDSYAQVIEFIKAFPGTDILSLKAWVIGKVSLYRKLVAGTAHITINGEKRERSDFEKEEDAKNLAGWEEAMSLLKPEIASAG